MDNTQLTGLRELAAREAVAYSFDKPTEEPSNISVVDHMGTDLTVINAARVSFNKAKDKSLFGVMDTGDRRLLRYLLRHQHTTPFRHAFLTFHVKAPIFVLRQWAKHQVGCSWNEISMRYVKHDLGFWCPDEWRSPPEGSIKQGSAGPIEYQDEASAIYDNALKVCTDAYQELLKAGVCREQARAILPQSMITEFWWTASLQAVLHFLDLRLAKDAQSEIRGYAKEIEWYVHRLFPETLQAWRDIQSEGKNEG
jgi:thymidylate synthase (FAD)